VISPINLQYQAQDFLFMCLLLLDNFTVAQPHSNYSLQPICKPATSMRQHEDTRVLPSRSRRLCRISSHLMEWCLNGFVFIFLIRIVGGGVQAGSTRHVGHWMAYCTCPGWLWWWTIWWNEDWQGKPKYSEETCPSATLSTTNPTRPDPGSNPGRRDGKPATNRLSYDAAMDLS
jgi:hypothetical protein